MPTDRLPWNVEDNQTGRPWYAMDRPQMTLDFRLENGDAIAFQYYSLVAPRLSGGFVKLYFEHGTVTIKGRLLKDLYQGLRRHRIEYVQERHASEFDVGEGAPYVERIEFGPPDLASLARRPI